MVKRLLLLAILVALIVPSFGSVEALTTLTVQLTANSIVFSGPGENSAYLEYAAEGREVIADGRNSNTSWIEINLDGQVVGWVPVETVVALNGGDLTTLDVRGGLLDLGGSAYDIEDPILRNVQLELIKVQRPMRYVGARYFRLQSYLNASCEAIPAAPAPPVITPWYLSRIPELDRVKRELTFVQEETGQAISFYEELCVTGGLVNETAYFDGLGHLNNAYSTFDTVQKYMWEITGLTFVVQ
jgi:uncharacterized protein YraI